MAKYIAEKPRLTNGQQREICQYKNDHPITSAALIWKYFNRKWPELNIGKTTIDEVLTRADEVRLLPMECDSVTRPSRKRPPGMEKLTIGKRKEICVYKQDNPTISHHAICVHFQNKWPNTKMARTTIRDIVKKSDELLAIPSVWDTTPSLAHVKYPQIDLRLYEWFNSEKQKGHNVTDALMINEAQYIARELDITDITIKIRWLRLFKKRHAINAYHNDADMADDVQKGTMDSLDTNNLHGLHLNSNNQCLEESQSCDDFGLEMKAQPTSLSDVRVCRLSTPVSADMETLENTGIDCDKKEQIIDEVCGQEREESLTLESEESQVPRDPCHVYDVTCDLMEARRSLMKVIAYVRTEAIISEQFLVMLHQLLVTLYNASDDELADNVVIKQETFNLDLTNGESNGIDDDYSSEDVTIKSESTGMFPSEPTRSLPDSTSAMEQTANASPRQDGLCILPRKLVRETSKKKFVPKKKSGKRMDQYTKFIEVTEDGKYKCTKCGNVLLGFHECKRHVKVVHFRVTLHQCPLCPRSFYGKGELNNHHKRAHLGQKIYNFLCPICGKDVQSLRTHMFTHSEERKAKCPHCDKAFRNESDVKGHVASVHEEKRPHQCSICGKSFKKSGALTIHRRRHSGEKPYKCFSCGMAFISSGERLKHHSNKHTDPHDWPLLSCKLCDKLFKTKQILDRHQRVHDGIRPYTCKICGNAFKHTGTLHSHMKTHTNK